MSFGPITQLHKETQAWIPLTQTEKLGNATPRSGKQPHVWVVDHIKDAHVVQRDTCELHNVSLDCNSPLLYLTVRTLRNPRASRRKHKVDCVFRLCHCLERAVLDT
jgi:hypothetical protein